MLRFQRALLGELIFIFVGVLAVVTTIIFAGITVRLVAKAQGAGVDLMLGLLPSMLPLALAFSIPFAWLAAVSLVLGRMVADREVTALRAAGIHLRVLAWPVLAVGALLTVTTTALNAFYVPEAQRTLRSGVRDYLPVFLTSLRNVDKSVALKNGRFSFREFEDGAFRDVELDRWGYDNQLQVKIIARKVVIGSTMKAGEQDALVFEFEDASLLRAAQSGQPRLDKQPERRMQMGQVERIGASVLFNEFFGMMRFIERPRDMPLPKLLYGAERGGVVLGSVHELLISLHAALAIGLAPLVLGLFAMGMALVLPPSGRRVRDFMFGFLPPVVLYFPLFLAAYATGGGRAVPEWVAMWGADILVGVLGVVVLVKAFRR